MSKKVILLACAAGLSLSVLAAPVAPRQKKAEAPAPVPEKSHEGLFTVQQSGDKWFFVIPDSLLGRRFLTTTRFTATPANCGKFAGEQVNQQTVYFEKAPDDKLLLRSELLINVSDTLQTINRAIVISNENPIINAFKLEKYKPGYSKIDVTSMFLADNPTFSLRQWEKDRFGLTALMGDRTFIQGIKTFPMNTEVKVTRTWLARPRLPAASQTGSVTFGFNVSFVLLPKVPMQRRLFDPRVGYFSDDFTTYTDHQQRVNNKRFITRWRLEPREEDIEKMKRGELVEPKKPIVYYIDPATPKQWRKYLIAGVNDWQKAFEKAGFKNAIMAKEWPENDSTMSMEDARYSVIRYLASPIENAYGPQVHDPRSGEILESHICWYHNVMRLLHDWYFIQAGTIDTAAQKMVYDEELMGELIRFVSSHEVGHTLGLRHNFGSSSTVPVDSLRSKAWVERYGHTPSIMDYARFNYVAQPEDGISRKGIFPRIGDYDMWAIQWGYTPMWNAYDDDSDHWELEKLVRANLPGNRRLWFGDGETNNVNDPRCQTEDLSDNAMKASTYGIKNLKRLLARLPEYTYTSNDIYSDNISSMYEEICQQFTRYIYHVVRQIGGIQKEYKTVDEPGAVYTPVSKAWQKEALKFIDENVFEEPTWLRELSYINRLTPNPQSVTESLGMRVVVSLTNAGFLERLNQNYTADAYLADLTHMLFRKLQTSGRATAYERALQQTYVLHMTENFSNGEGLDDVRAYVLAELRNVRKLLSTVSAADAKTRAHVLSLIDAIDRNSLKIK